MFDDIGIKEGFMLMDKHNNQPVQIHSKKHVNVSNVARLIISIMTCANINPDISLYPTATQNIMWIISGHRLLGRSILNNN